VCSRGEECVGVASMLTDGKSRRTVSLYIEEDQVFRQPCWGVLSSLCCVPWFASSRAPLVEEDCVGAVDAGQEYMGLGAIATAPPLRSG